MNKELNRIDQGSLEKTSGGALPQEPKVICPVCKKLTPVSVFEQNGGYCSARCREKAQK